MIILLLIENLNKIIAAILLIVNTTIIIKKSNPSITVLTQIVVWGFRYKWGKQKMLVF